MNEQLIIDLCAILLGGLIVYSAAVLIGAAIFDIIQISKAKKLAAMVRKLAAPRQPHVALLILARNNADTIERCLDSIRNIQYKNYSVTVIDTMPTDSARRMLSEYMLLHPKFALKTIYKRRPDSRAASIRAALKKAGAKDYVFILDATDRLHPKAIKRAVAQFTVDKSLGALQLNSVVPQQPSLFILLQRFMAASNNQRQKAGSLLPVLTHEFAGSGTMYDVQLFKRITSLSANSSAVTFHKQYISQLGRVNYAYCSHAHMVRGASPSFASFILPFKHPARLVSLSPIVLYSELWRFVLQASIRITYVIKAFAIMLLPFAISYFIFTAVTFRSTSFLTYSWLLLMFWLLAAVWSDDRARPLEKLELTLSAPMTYFIVYVQLFVYFLANIWRALAILFAKLNLGVILGSPNNILTRKTGL